MKQKIVIISQDGYVAETAGIMAENGTAEIIDARGGLENACAETVMSKADALMFEGNISDVELAKSYSITAAAVERNIRTTIERCRELNPENFCAGFFGSPCTAMRQRPTAKEFISTVAEKISLEMVCQRDSQNLF